MLFSRDARQRLKPVRVVRRAVLDGPFLDGLGDGVGGRNVQRFAMRDRACPGLLQGFPDECEESPLPQPIGVWKTAIIR